MKCLTRLIFGVIIATINVLFFVSIFIAMIFIYLDSWQNKSDKIRILDGLIISVCFVMVVVSGLLILGIFKKLPQLMWPWLVLTGIGLVSNAGQAAVTLILGLINKNPFQTLILTLAIDTLAVVFQVLSFWLIFTLCREINRRNDEELRSNSFEQADH